jgi:hypothetical protein
MRHLICTLLLLFSWSIDLPAQQQEDLSADSADVASGPEIVAANEELEIELAQALGDLAQTLGALATRLANDPELRVNAVRAASSLVTVAQVVVEEQSGVIEETLRRAADMIAEMPTEIRIEHTEQ